MVPLCVWLILRDAMFAAFWVFVAAALSDAVDGYLAKRLNAVTKLGGYLDPIADKALLVSAFLALGASGHIPSWLVILVVFRDLLIISGAILYQAITQNLKMEPILISKVNTVAQLMFVVMVLAQKSFELSFDVTMDIAAVLVGITTFLSGAAYVRLWSRRAGELENGYEKNNEDNERHRS